MADLILLSWRDIPAQVIVRRGRTAEKRELPERFIQAVDRAAMAVGARDSDAYLSQWVRSAPVTVGDDLAAEADAAVAHLLASYSDDRLAALVANGGHEPARSASP